jgi:hypothetical protein
VRAIGRLTKPREVDGTTVKGINFFEPGDSALLHALQNPGVNMAASAGRIRCRSGNVHAQPAVATTAPLLDIGVIKRVTGTYRYYLTKAGRAATTAAERLKQATIVPAMI